MIGNKKKANTFTRYKCVCNDGDNAGGNTSQMTDRQNKQFDNINNLKRKNGYRFDFGQAQS